MTVDAKRKPGDPVEVTYLRVANVQRGFLDLTAVKTIVVERGSLGDLSLRSGDILLNEGVLRLNARDVLDDRIRVDVLATIAAAASIVLDMPETSRAPSTAFGGPPPPLRG